MVVLGLVLLGLGEASVGRAAPVTVTRVEPGDRRILLEWAPLPGDTLTPDERRESDARAFGGYVVWRGISSDSTQLLRLRTFALLDSTWTFVGSTRRFVDPDSVLARGEGPDPETPLAVPGPFNGFAYYYAVTAYDASVDSIAGTVRVREYLLGGVGEALDAGIAAGQLPVVPQATPRIAPPLLREVRVVPNPYALSAPWDAPGRRRVQFIHLPTPCRISIYTLAGDFVRELEHTAQNDGEDWDLRNGDGREVTSGIYVYHVEAETGEERRGHFVVVR
jgi:hypothetical protein